MSFPSRLMLILFSVGLVLVIAGSAVAADESPAPVSAVVESQESTSSPVMIDVENSSNYLSPAQENVTQEAYSAVSLDVSSAVHSDSASLQGEHERLVLERKLNATEERDALELDTARSLERNVQQLEQEHQQLLEEYSNGATDTQTLAREVVRLNVIAEQYDRLAETVEENGNPTGSVGTRYSNLQGESMLLPSPLTNHLESGLTTGDSTPTYIQGGNESLVLATVVGDTYVREAVMFSERDRIAPQQFGSGEQSEANDAFARAEELYPWTVSDSFRPELRGFGNSSVYELQASHSHGELQTYLDGATTNPFYEVHEKNVFSVPLTDLAQSVDDGLRLNVQLTDPTGPMRIEVIETGNQNYDNITVEVGNDRVAELSSGDLFYTVQPRGTFEVSAETDTGENVSVLVFP